MVLALGPLGLYKQTCVCMRKRSTFNSLDQNGFFPFFFQVEFSSIVLNGIIQCLFVVCVVAKQLYLSFSANHCLSPSLPITVEDTDDTVNVKPPSKSDSPPPKEVYPNGDVSIDPGNVSEG